MSASKPKPKVTSSIDVEEFVPEGSVDDFLEEEEEGGEGEEEEGDRYVGGVSGWVGEEVGG